MWLRLHSIPFTPGPVRCQLFQFVISLLVPKIRGSHMSQPQARETSILHRRQLMFYVQPSCQMPSSYPVYCSNDMLDTVFVRRPNDASKSQPWSGMFYLHDLMFKLLCLDLAKIETTSEEPQALQRLDHSGEPVGTFGGMITNV